MAHRVAPHAASASYELWKLYRDEVVCRSIAVEVLFSRVRRS
jgi:hypothetical protein